VLFRQRRTPECGREVGQTCQIENQAPRGPSSATLTCPRDDHSTSFRCHYRSGYTCLCSPRRKAVYLDWFSRCFSSVIKLFRELVPLLELWITGEKAVHNLSLQPIDSKPGFLFPLIRLLGVRSCSSAGSPIPHLLGVRTPHLDSSEN
jgi:hypothetical protein